MLPTGRILLAILLSLVAVPASADTFTYTDDAGQEQTVEARLAGAGQGAFALELADGSWRIVTEAAVKRRVPGADPQPISPEGLAGQLEERFTPELFRHAVSGNFIVGLVLTAPLDEAGDERLTDFFDKATRFMESIDRVFTRFAEEMRLELTPARFPLVMLIFETDELFETYAVDASASTGLSTGNIAGFYSALTNLLALRLDECDSFAVPLHEAIHQQVFNRGVFQRLAPVPVWFNEGIATGFENDGARITADPTKVNRTFGGLATQPLGIDIATMLSRDDAFRGDVLAGDAYTLAWCLHWLLVTERPDEYTTYVRQLGTREPLQPPVSGADRVQEFTSTFQLEPGGTWDLFVERVSSAARRQRVRLEAPQVAVGNLVTQDNTGSVEIGLVRRGDLGGRVQCIGKLKNLSPFRTLSFRVSLEPPGGGDDGAARWVAQSVGPGRVVNLDRQFLADASASAFRVVVESALPESEAARAWGE